MYLIYTFEDRKQIEMYFEKLQKQVFPTVGDNVMFDEKQEYKIVKRTFVYVEAYDKDNSPTLSEIICKCKKQL